MRKTGINDQFIDNKIFIDSEIKKTKNYKKVCSIGICIMSNILSFGLGFYIKLKYDNDNDNDNGSNIN